jgi:hypothetical protein
LICVLKQLQQLLVTEALLLQLLTILFVEILAILHLVRELLLMKFALVGSDVLGFALLLF